MNCDELDAIAAELAAGTLTGPERAEALTHVGACARCAREVADFALAADALLHAAPSVEPPVGFETRVVEAIRARQRRHTPRRWTMLAAAAAVVVAVGVAGIVTRRGNNAPAPIRAAAMRAEDGRRVGYAYVSTGHPDRLLVQIHGLAGSDVDYRVVVVSTSGAQATAGNVALRGGAVVADLTSPLPVASLVRVRLIGTTGEHECEGTFGQI